MRNSEDQVLEFRYTYFAEKNIIYFIRSCADRNCQGIIRQIVLSQNADTPDWCAFQPPGKWSAAT